MTVAGQQLEAIQDIDGGSGSHALNGGHSPLDKGLMLNRPLSPKTSMSANGKSAMSATADLQAAGVPGAGATPAGSTPTRTTPEPECALLQPGEEEEVWNGTGLSAEMILNAIEAVAGDPGQAGDERGAPLPGFQERKDRGAGVTEGGAVAMDAQLRSPAGSMPATPGNEASETEAAADCMKGHGAVPVLPCESLPAVGGGTVHDRSQEELWETEEAGALADVPSPEPVMIPVESAINPPVNPSLSLSKLLGETEEEVPDVSAAAAEPLRHDGYVSNGADSPPCDDQDANSRVPQLAEPRCSEALAPLSCAHAIRRDR